MFKRKKDDLFFPHDPDDLMSLDLEKSKNNFRMAGYRFPIRLLAFLALFGLFSGLFIPVLMRSFGALPDTSAIVAETDGILVTEIASIQSGIVGGSFSEANWTILASDQWQSYGDLVVQTGDTIIITVVSGAWSSKASSALYGADGSNFTCSSATTCTDPLPTAPQGALIARIGGGAPFKVGAEFDQVVQDSGLIEFRMNDASYTDNVGSVQIHITVTSP